MTQTIEAVFESGVLRPLQPLHNVAENDTVRLRVETSSRRRNASGYGIAAGLDVTVEQFHAAKREDVKRENDER